MTFSVHGLAVARGIAIGRAVLVASSRVDVAHYFVEPSQVEGEIERVRQGRNAVVEELQRQAENRFREQEEVLQQRLAATEQKLAELQSSDPEQALELTAEQESALQQFLQEKLRIRKELREVRYQLNADIEALGRTLKFANIVLVPLLLTLAALALWLWRRRRA